MSSPLSVYLDRHGISQAKFAQRGGWRQATVSGWCNGVVPSIPLALQIESATEGEVTVNDWAAFASANNTSFGTDTVDRIAVQDAASGESAT